MVKLVRIIARLNVGGPARHVVWATAGLREKFDSLLVTGTVPPEEDDMGYFAENHGVKPIVIPQMSREISLKDAFTIWKLFRLFLRERPDIVHTHTAKAGTAGRVAGIAYKWLTPSILIGRPRRCRFVHTYHGHVFHSYYGKLKTRVFLGIEKSLARLVTDCIVVISPQQFEEINGDFGVGRSEQFRVIPLGLDLESFSNSRNRRNRLRGELSAGESDVLIGIVGRLTEIKNHLLFIEAAARWKQAYSGQNRTVRFLVIGDGKLREELSENARRLGVDDIVEFLGTRNDPEYFYPALDVVALTSLNEGTPLTLIEAMANERPCIATSVGGVIDLIGRETRHDEGTSFRICERGILAPSGDSTALCEGFQRLIEDTGLREELGARGGEFALSSFSKARLLSDLERLYNEMMGLGATQESMPPDSGPPSEVAPSELKRQVLDS